MLRIENGKLVGTIIRPAVQYCHGSPDVNKYPVKVRVDGAPMQLIEDLLMEGAIIRSRKKYRVKSQVALLANGVSLVAYVSTKVPQTADELSASIDMDQMSDEALAALQAKVEARLAAKAAADTEE